MGVLHLSPDDFYDMTLREFFCALKGHYQYEADIMEGHQKLLYSGLRFNASSIANGLSNDLAKAIHNIKFDWEKDQEETQSKKSGKFTYGDMLNMFGSKKNKQLIN